MPTKSENNLPQIYLDAQLQRLVNSVINQNNDKFNAASESSHPWLRLELARAERMDWEWRQAKSMLYPQVQVGFVKQSFQGFIQLPQGDVFYDKKPQFSQWQIGLQVPLFTTSVRQEANSKQSLWKAQILQAEYTKSEIDAEYNKLNQQKINLIGQLDRYQNTLLPNSVQSFDIANFQLSVGAISVFQWELLVRGLTQNYLDYFGSIQDLSFTQLMLTYYKSN
jgi:outer membrane protein TolC